MKNKSTKCHSAFTQNDKLSQKFVLKNFGFMCGNKVKYFKRDFTLAAAAYTVCIQHVNNTCTCMLK